MTGFVFRNGDLNDLATKFQVRETDIKIGIPELMREVVAEATVEQAKVLEGAHTPTGEARADGSKISRYGSKSPGRVDSGLMINTILGRVEEDGNSTRGQWGHFDPEKYFSYQDDGTKKIMAAHSLLISFIHARERVISGLATLARGK